MYALTKSPFIDAEIDGIYTYIINELDAPMAAEHLMTELLAKIEYIQDTPYHRSIINDPYLCKLEVHSIKVKNYLLFYCVHENPPRVHLLRFMHSRRDWQNILQDYPDNETG
jgi:plasmid stabilization system protein ParE